MDYDTGLLMNGEYYWVSNECTTQVLRSARYFQKRETLHSVLLRLAVRKGFMTRLAHYLKLCLAPSLLS